MVDWNRDTWSNWVGDVVVEHPERRYYPKDLADLLTIVRDAESSRPTRRVHAAGSHWAFADVAVSPDWFVETHALNRTLSGVIPRALNEHARAELAKRETPESDPVSYYHVEAGVTIRELNLRLDGVVESRDKGERATPDRDPSPTAGDRWALHTMGGSSGQTLAGAISTGTHGGDHQLPPLADALQAIHLVAPGARQLWIERDEGVTDASSLKDALPGVEPHYSSELFNAVLVSLGRMGIIYAVVLKVVRQFWLREEIQVSTWEAEARRLRDLDAFGDTRFLQALVAPYPRRDGARSCYVTRRWRVPDGSGRLEEAGPDLFSFICGRETVGRLVLPVLLVAAPVVGVTLFLLNFRRAAVVAIIALLVALVGVLPVRQLLLGDALSRVLNACNRLGQPWITRRLGELVLKRAQPAGTKSGIGYEIMDLGRLGGGQCYKGDSIELAFDATTGAHVDFMQEELFPACERIAAAGLTVGGYVSLRFTGRSEAFLAMQQWPVTCSMEVALLKGMRGNASIFRELEAAAVRHGATVHWGQRISLGRKEVERLYPMLSRWRAQLGWITQSEEHEATFDNAFCARSGLEPPAP